MDKIQIYSTIKLEATAETHPNKQPFKGILCSVGSASTLAPIGSAGKKVILSSDGSANAIETLKGMPLNVVWDDPKGKFTGHQQETVIGIIANAWIQEDDVWVEGYLFPQNYPKICASIKQEKDDLGFSYEVLASASETKDNTMIINEFTFIGACILYKDRAAYGEDTQLITAQTTNTKDGNENMDEKVFQAMIDAMFANVDKKIEAIQASVGAQVTAIETKIEASATAANTKVAELAAALAETNEVIKAAAEVVPVVPVDTVVPVVDQEVVPVAASAAPVVAPAPTILAAGQTVVPNGDFAGAKKDKKAKIAEIHASATMNIQEKIHAIVRINAGIED